MKQSMSLLDMLEAAASADTITREEFTVIMQSGTDEEKKEAVARMIDAGGYENLD